MLLSYYKAASEVAENSMNAKQLSLEYGKLQRQLEAKTQQLESLTSKNAPGGQFPTDFDGARNRRYTIEFDVQAGSTVPVERSVNIETGTIFRCAYVPQQEDFPPGKTAGEIIEQTLHSHGVDQGDTARRASIYLGAAGFNDDSVLVDSLSGGWKKRLSIACALALEPDCVLLDEPTNHLDIDSILWLENYLDSLRCAVAFVSHDR
jgi:ABC-type glutathione transport system ATPase component